MPAMVGYLNHWGTAALRSQVKSAYQSNSAITDIDVTFDGTWLTRGHSSQIGVGCVIDLLTGFVMGFEIMSKRCIESELAKSGLGENSAEFFMCDKNKDRRLHINHVSKRLGTSLRKAVKEWWARGVSLGGKSRGSLKEKTIKKLSQYYQNAIHWNKGDVEAMKTAIYATLFHSISTDQKPQHLKCPTGKDYWCFFQASLARGEVPGPHVKHVKTPLKETHLAKIMPIYQRLASNELLQRCIRCVTQNANESLHIIIWVKEIVHRVPCPLNEILFHSFPDDCENEDDDCHKEIRSDALIYTSVTDDPPFTIHEINAVINKLKLKKAPGPDSIPNEVVKKLHEMYPDLFLTVLNSCLRLKTFPRCWKKARIILIPKVNDVRVPKLDNLRCISLLSTLGHSSKEKFLNKGCPQGSVSGPFLWNVIINDFLEKILAFSSCETIAFADDLLLCFQGKSFHDICRQAQLTLDFASNWTNSFKLEFNAVKSKVMFLEKREKNALLLATSPLMGLNKVARNSFGIKSNVSSLIYKQGIVPFICYRSQIWGSALKKKIYCRLLRKIQRRIFLRVISGYRPISYEAVFAISGFPPIDIFIIRNNEFKIATKNCTNKCLDGSLRLSELPHPSERFPLSLVNYRKNIENNFPVVCFTDGSKINTKVGLAFGIFQDFIEIGTLANLE
ncbi:uncharacterized protein TNCV_2240161 [Trichonephila clavipes]|nr:uncharacterized protein TNCV_2240161 [Trichonephila clavipes]